MGSGVKPPTFHLITQIIRHSRGILTAIDKWTAQQEPCATNLEISRVTSFMRTVLSTFEYQLEQVAVDVQEEDTVETT